MTVLLMNLYIVEDLLKIPWRINCQGLLQKCLGSLEELLVLIIEELKQWVRDLMVGAS